MLRRTYGELFDGISAIEAILREVQLSDENIAAILKRVLPG